MRIQIQFIILISFVLSLIIACNSSRLPSYSVTKDPCPQLNYRYVNTSKGFSFDYPYYGHRFFKNLDKRALIFIKNLGIKNGDIAFYESTYLSHHFRTMAVLYAPTTDTAALVKRHFNTIKKNKTFSDLRYTPTPSVKLDSTKHNLMTWQDYRIRLDTNIAFAQLEYKAVLDKNDFLCNEYYVSLKDKSILRLIHFVNSDTSLFDDSDTKFDTAWFKREANFNLAYFKQPIPILNFDRAITEPFKLASEASKQGVNSYLSPILALQRDSALYDSVRHEFMGMYHQAMMTYYSLAGFQEEAIAMRDTAMGYSRPDSCPPNMLKGYEAIDAVDFISKQLPQRRLVMLNEAHHAPINRLFAIKLLDSLKKNGFKYLALETLSRNNTANKWGFPSIDDGFYLREPMYGELIRQAKIKGFELIAYDESDSECIPPPDAHRFYCHNIREQNAAKNIMKVFKKDAKAKVFVLVGHDHNYKDYLLAQRKRRDGQKWKFLAIVLKEMSGFDPLSINQSDLMERALREYENPLYRCVWLNFAPDKPVVLTKNGQSWIKPEMEGMVDAYIFHPRTSRETPYEWLTSLGYSAFVLDLKDIKEAYFTQTFYTTELIKLGKKAVPAFNMPTYNESSLTLYLKPNTPYITRVYDKNGQVLKEIKIQNNAPHK